MLEEIRHLRKLAARHAAATPAPAAAPAAAPAPPQTARRPDTESIASAAAAAAAAPATARTPRAPRAFLTFKPWARDGDEAGASEVRPDARRDGGDLVRA